ncbi:hypothetical protein DFP72DRAFT_867638 [Ephemerocybe angulata]|uniref:Uncharacterized protein n=1 Tax=Ephemerocybe angulata TaxID=980116 RepID=A0A8H6IGS9_9AGAR|nr:hypothetical protein DFP72DRAFT_867638 [Tulosesus angulatus]
MPTKMPSTCQLSPALCCKARRRQKAGTRLELAVLLKSPWSCWGAPCARAVRSRPRPTRLGGSYWISKPQELIDGSIPQSDTRQIGDGTCLGHRQSSRRSPPRYTSSEDSSPPVKANLARDPLSFGDTRLRASWSDFVRSSSQARTRWHVPGEHRIPSAGLRQN